MGEGPSLRRSPAIRWTELGLGQDAGLRLGTAELVAYRADLVWHLAVVHEVAVARCTQQPYAFFLIAETAGEPRRSPIRATYRAMSDGFWWTWGSDGELSVFMPTTRIAGLSRWMAERAANLAVTAWFPPDAFQPRSR